MDPIVPEEIDLEKLRSRLADEFGDAPPTGYIRGKTALRAAVVRDLDCSELEAEQLVETLESRGFIRYHGHKSNTVDDLEHRWALTPNA